MLVPTQVRMLRSTGDPRQLLEFCLHALPEADCRSILIKPNWVRHQDDPAFPIGALVTGTALVEAALEACLLKYPRAHAITVGDAPLQSCNWDLLMAQTGVDRLIARYSGSRMPVIRFLDLRQQLSRPPGPHPAGSDRPCSDPLHREVVLDADSFLAPVSHAAGTFRVADYRPEETISSHSGNLHRYSVAACALDCDLLINLPKMKTHQKAGITGALKNLVGINGDKARLVHFREGSLRRGGDEFPRGVSPLVLLQSRLRQGLQRSPALFKAARLAWPPLKALAGIHTRGTPENLRKNFYLAAGAWYGNDTIWRMVYDLNRIVRFADAAGRMTRAVQRACVSILDGLVAGEGNGPLQPLPVPLGVLLAASDPFALDMVMARLMGFDYRNIPCLLRHRAFADAVWGAFSPDGLVIDDNGEFRRGLDSVPILHSFLAPPGWASHIEYGEEHAAGTMPAAGLL